MARCTTYPLPALTGAPVAQARAAAVLAWLAAHALIAWTLRTQPALPWRANPAFPAWALAALATGIIFTLTPPASASACSLAQPAGWPPSPPSSSWPPPPPGPPPARPDRPPL